MNWGWPKDLTLYDWLKDWLAAAIGDTFALLAAIIALAAAYFAYRATLQAARIQIKALEDDNLKTREAEARTEAREQLLAIELIDAALEAVIFDIGYVRNKFDIVVFSQSKSSVKYTYDKITPEKIRRLTQQVNEIALAPLLPYIGRLGVESAREFMLLDAIIHRIRSNESAMSYEELGDELEGICGRAKGLKAELAKERESIRVLLAPPAPSGDDLEPV